MESSTGVSCQSVLNGDKLVGLIIGRNGIDVYEKRR